ncbi:MAG: DUF1501 domain-containing protein [Pirellulales bacterium]
MTHRSAVCAGPLSRRSFLQVGSLGAAGLGSTGLGMSDLLRLRTAGAVDSAKAENAVIFVWLPGGAPHMETYDLKPEAPSDYRGEMRPIPTAVSGLDVCELLPLHAKTAPRYNIVRSIAHTFADHGGGHKKFLTGRDPREPVGFVNDYPMVGSVVAKCREQRRLGLPNYICGADNGRTQVDTFSFGAAYLGTAYTPFTFGGDPSSSDFKIQNLGVTKEVEDRLGDRMQLLSGFDNLRRRMERTDAMEALDKFNQQAISMLLNERTREAFDLSQESDALRDRYGRHAWGQRCLLARRLVEAGSSFVTMVLENPYLSGIPWLKEGTYNWDSHAVNCHMFHDLRVRLPIYDQAVTALVEDIYQRGLDRRVLVIVTGEFGRTPRINPAIGTQTGVMQPGRDHWPQAMSLLVCGGGMRTGQVIGSTNPKGEHPQDRPLQPSDLWATMYRHMGIDWRQAFLDHNGRPTTILPDGEPISELLPA